MEMSERQVGDVTILDLDGALTLDEGAERLKHKVDSLLLQQRTSIVLNLAGVRYIDSCGLGQMVACYNSVAKTTGGLKLLHVGARNRTLLTITRLLGIFSTFESEDEAVRSFPELLSIS